MLHGMDQWADWPYGAHDPHRAREINELLEIASDHEAANDPEVLISEEPEDLDEELVERLEVALEEVALEKVMPDPFAEDEDLEQDSE